MGTRHERIGVIVADDHPVYRQGLAEVVRRRPDLRLVGTASTGREALEVVLAEKPQVLLLDLHMPDLDGIAVVKALRREEAATRVLIVSGYVDSETVYAAIGAGADGFLSKVAEPDEIHEAIATVARGETVLAPAVQSAVAEEVRRRSPHEGPILTDREHEILALTAEGLSAPAIGERLHLGATTVRTHLQHLYEKLGVTDRAAAVAKAIRLGLLDG